MQTHIFRSPAALALAAAALFGASTPLAKELLNEVSPALLAGLLYLGSGMGLALVRLLRDRGWRPPDLAGREWLWLLLAIAFGGVLAPLAMMVGLSLTSAAAASLLLNLEAVLTATLAWIAFGESANRRIVIGMVLIVLGAVLLGAASPTELTSASFGWGATLIAAACLCWALDNNLTRKVSASDAVFIAGTKGLVAGIVNIAIALLAARASWPAPTAVGLAMAVGLLGYGLSLVLFVLALRGVGAARTGAYFSTAPFIGAVLAIVFFGEHASASFLLAALLMAIGVWLHLTEPPAFLHAHRAIVHTHWHWHDAEHQHVHDFPWDGREPHNHEHVHAPSTPEDAHEPSLQREPC